MQPVSVSVCPQFTKGTRETTHHVPFNWEQVTSRASETSQVNFPESLSQCESLIWLTYWDLSYAHLYSYTHLYHAKNAHAKNAQTKIGLLGLERLIKTMGSEMFWIFGHVREVASVPRSL